MRNLYIYITALFILGIIVILYMNGCLIDHVDNLADASCYSGRIVLGLED